MNMHRENRKLTQYITTTITIAGLIFFFSSQPAEESGQLSGFFTSVIEWFLGDILPEELLGFLVRKAAHISIYFLLGWSVRLLIGQIWRRRALKIQRPQPAVEHIWQAGCVSILLCFLYACSDEWHQTFVPGRDGTFRDVCIDGIGFCLAILLLSLWKMWSCYRKEGQSYESGDNAAAEESAGTISE